MAIPARPTWDIFCAVVDNFGDIGVCWRLARQLANEHAVAVRLWVDDLTSFRRLNAALDPALDAQTSYGVEVRRWTRPFPDATPADVVIETFGCELPENYLAAMAVLRSPQGSPQGSPPAWINLEYLSAESWVAGYHALPSPHPRLPLTKHYFFPGFTSGTGGLLREHWLLQRRLDFQRDSAAQAAFWRALGLAMPAAEELRVSLFCYENPGLTELLQGWAAGPERITCLVPEGRAEDDITATFRAEEKFAPRAWRRDRLELRVLPFLDQADYDHLLWACDGNFVRGEDSFVRALWAARPLVWHIYPQAENAHWVKLNAFIDLYTADMAAAPAAALRDFWRAWNGGRNVAATWTDFRGQWPALGPESSRFAERLQGQRDLAGNLLNFCHNLIK